MSITVTSQSYNSLMDHTQTKNVHMQVGWDVSELDSLQYTPCLKKEPTLASCSFDKHDLILIIFGKQHCHTFKNDMQIQLFLCCDVNVKCCLHHGTAAKWDAWFYPIWYVAAKFTKWFHSQGV